MKDLQKKIDSFINIQLGSSVFLIVLGIICLIAPGTLLDIIRWAIAIFCLAAGAYMLASDIRRKAPVMFSTTLVGVVLLILGLVFAANPGIMDIFPIVIGAWFVISGVASVRFSAGLRGTSAGTYALVTSILSLICGILMILNPWGGQVAIMVFSGIMMIIYGAPNLVDMAVLKHNLNDLAKNFKKALGKK